MPACPECASEVADTDIYCPYCGISLTPPVLPPEPEDPFAQTIVTSLSDLAAAPAKEPEPETPAPAPEQAAAAEPSPEPAAEIEPASEAVSSSAFETPQPETDDEPELELPVSGEPEEKRVEPSTPESPADLEGTLYDSPYMLDDAGVSGEEAAEEPAAEYVAHEPAIVEEHTEEDSYLGPIDVVPVDPGAASPEAEPAKEELPVPPIPSVLSSELMDATPEPFREEEPVEAFAAPEEEIPAAAPQEETPQITPYEEAPAVAASEEAPHVEPQEQAPEAAAAPAELAGNDAGNFEEQKDAAGTSSISGSSDGSAKPRLKILTGGTVLNNRYEIVKKIGGGGMGAVYLSNDRNLGGVPRAVKEMVQAHIEDAQQAKAIEDFRRESMILSSLDHPSIPTIYDYFFDSSEGRFYLVMKYISGGDLAGRLRSAPEGRIDELTVAEWGFQIADVLSYLHGLPQRIVYRDLKPSNVMLDGSTGKIMLIDFGIARSVNQIEEKGVTAVGTMGYAPPELFSGNVEPRSDIYSLGSTMFHLMTGADPQNNPLLIFDFDKNPRPRQINPRLSDQIEKILMRCVEYSADKRFSTAAELRDALGEHADNLRSGRVTFGIGAAPVAVGLDEQTVFCGFCGQRIVAADMFCAFCGARQPLAQNAPPPAAVSFVPQHRSLRTARLVVDGTTDLEAPVFVIEKPENLLGRRDPMSNIFPEVDLSKYDPQTKISRRHARIVHDGADFLVEDLGSSNGTTVLTGASGNLRLRPHQPHRLANGDRIKLGDTTLHFWVG